MHKIHCNLYHRHRSIKRAFDFITIGSHEGLKSRSQASRNVKKMCALINKTKSESRSSIFDSDGEHRIRGKLDWEFVTRMSIDTHSFDCSFLCFSSFRLAIGVILHNYGLDPKSVELKWTRGNLLFPNNRRRLISICYHRKENLCFHIDEISRPWFIFELKEWLLQKINKYFQRQSPQKNKLRNFAFKTSSSNWLMKQSDVRKTDNTADWSLTT